MKGAAKTPGDDRERSVIADIKPVNATYSVEQARLDGGFTADWPNRKWLAGFTCIRTASGWPCVAVVRDCRQ